MVLFKTIIDIYAIINFIMELFSRRRLRLISAQVVSCCVYENTNNRDSASRAITKVV